MNAAQSGGHTGSSVGKKGSQLEELVAISPERRNWRGIFIALLVIAAVFSLIIFSIFLLSPEDEGARIKGRRMTLSDITGKSLRWKPFNGTWSNDVELIYRDPTGGLSILSLENYTTRVLMTNSTFRQLNAESFVVSPDQKYVLLVSDSNTLGSRYHVYEVQTRNTFPLAPKENTADAPLLQLVMWAPNSATSNGYTSVNNGKQSGSSQSSNSGKTVSQAIAFVHENDLYYKPKVQGDLVCRLTTTGDTGVIFNGIPDWMYANVPELMSQTLAFSPDGMFLSFLSFNDSLVREYKYTWMGDNIKYPEVRTVRYPKTGTINPNVTVYVVNLTVLKYIFPQQIKLPAELSNGSYVGGMTWVSPTDLSVTITDREQTKAMTVICRAPAFACFEVHTEVTISDGWVLPSEAPIFSKYKITNPNIPILNATNTTKTDGNASTTNSEGDKVTNEFTKGGYILRRLPVRDGEHGYFRHVVFISSFDKRTVPLTMGRFEVTEILGWDETNEVVYFMAAPERKPGQRHLYKIYVRSNVIKPSRVYITASPPTCLTCDNSQSTFKLVSFNENQTTIVTTDEEETELPNNCLYNKIYFSKDYSYYVQECLGPDSPSVYLVDTQTNHKIYVLHAGDLLRRRLGQLALPQIRTFSVEIRHGFQAQVRLFLPPGMKEDEEVAFPLVLQVDAAPGSQLVSEKFQVDWNWYLCSQRSMIIAQIDARGSGFQGELLRNQIHGKLGTIEIEDQLGVLTYLRDNLKFVDPARICSYGWGYGGYAAALTLADDSQQVIQCSISINPVVSFGYHYSFFTERYIPMGGDYLRALQESDLTSRVENIKNRNLMIVHGTADLFIHQEHSLMLARALIDHDVKFRHQVYTDEDHKLSGSLVHLYKTLEWYIDDCFGPMDDNEWDPAGFFVFKQ
ncbi:inactive dipeptidyl peptidase 10 isoform X2 [Hermetia illucens]|uniref:inactive dipeptidyl peptidase 10 isoform X2 n=1 Tax=Hermetia illucens TaxID=343691 RepID=UPI0018CC2BDF|nr:inactive dipeptidyl peptidase 10 isoform X2 [Hermetia illucens]XP_037906980.1 inactive dipeptidyl peptidase 10 isoform X2 [Hermetia illucens]XP_037906988.1 inactive dipeptidyl peptidase 10 isoform X2 [Hermetia illucens]